MHRGVSVYGTFSASQIMKIYDCSNPHTKCSEVDYAAHTRTCMKTKTMKSRVRKIFQASTIGMTKSTVSSKENATAFESNWNNVKECETIELWRVETH